MKNSIKQMLDEMSNIENNILPNNYGVDNDSRLTEFFQLVTGDCSIDFEIIRVWNLL